MELDRRRLPDKLRHDSFKTRAVLLEDFTPFPLVRKQEEAKGSRDGKTSIGINWIITHKRSL